MNNQNIIVYDFETGGKKKNVSQPIQIAAIALDPKKLEVLEGGVFESLMKPILDDDEAIELGLEPLQDKALDINHKTREELAKAPKTAVVWDAFGKWVKTFNPKGNKWGRPVKAGFNNFKFDDIIVDRLCGQEPYKLGPYDDEYGQEDMFHPIHAIDVMKLCWYWFESIDLPMRGMSMDALREYFGMQSENAHDALVDVVDTAEILVRFLKLSRYCHNGLPKPDFTNVRFNNCVARKGRMVVLP